MTISLICPPIYECRPSTPVCGKAMLDPNHVMDALGEEAACVFGRGAGPAHVDPDRESPEVPIALGSGTGALLGGLQHESRVRLHRLSFA